MKLSKDQLTSFISQFDPIGSHTLFSYIIENGTQNAEQHRYVELDDYFKNTNLCVHWNNFVCSEILDVSKLGIDYHVKELSTDADHQTAITYIENHNEFIILRDKCIIDLENIITFDNLSFTVSDYLDSLNEHKVVGIFGFEFIDNIRVNKNNEYYVSFTERYSDNEYIECEQLIGVLFGSTYNSTYTKSRISFDEILSGQFVDITLFEMGEINNQISNYDFSNSLTIIQKQNLVRFAYNLTSISASVFLIRAITKNEVMISYTDCPEFKDFVNKYTKKIEIARSMYY